MQLSKGGKEALELLLGFSRKRRSDSLKLASLVAEGRGEGDEARQLAAAILEDAA